TIAGFRPGAYAYGRSDEVICTNCVLPMIWPQGLLEKGPSDAGVNSAYTMSNGTITIPNSLGAVRWSVPGTNLMWGVGGRVFHVIDVTQDTNNTYVQTDLP